jgi:hypothetical protein
VRIVLPEKVFSDKLDGATPIAMYHREAFLNMFRTAMFREFGKWSFQIANPEVLQFARKGRITKVWTTEPLEFRSARLGYHWTYYDADITIDGRRVTSVKGLVAIDSMETLNEAQHNRRLTNRMAYYLGSWNHLASSLFDGRADVEGFHFYQQMSTYSRKRPRYAKLTADVLKKVNADSLLIPAGGQMLFHVRPGLEVRNENRKAKQKLYKGLSEQVLRLSSDTSFVTLAHCGSFDPTELYVTGREPTAVLVVPAKITFVLTPEVTKKIVIAHV